MSEQETKEGSNKEKRDTAKGQPAQTDISLDIENALSFIETDEYEKTPPSEPPPAAKKDAASDKAVTPEKTPEQKTVTLSADKEKAEGPPIGRVERPAAPQEALTRGVSEKNKGSKMWILLVGVAVLLVIVLVFWL